MLRSLILPSYLGGGFGHIGRCLAVAGALKARGWQCEFSVAGPHADKVRRAGHEVYEPRYPFRPKPRATAGAAFTVLTDMSFQLARDRFETPRIVRAAVRETQRLIKRVRPDVLIGDTWPLTAIVGRQCGIPVVQIVKSYVHPACPRLIWWTEPPPDVVGPNIQVIFNQVLEGWRLPSIERAEHLLAGDLCLVPGIPELDPLPPDLPSTHYVGALAQSESLTAEWRDWFDRHPKDRPLIYVTLGGGADPVGGRSLFQVLYDALADLPVRVIVSTGKFEPSDLAAPPKNVELKKWVPGRAMIGYSDIVIFPGSHGTLMETVLCGVPSLSIPFHSEQEATARRLEASGAGVVLRHSDGPFEPVRVRWRGGAFTVLAAARSTLTPAQVHRAVDRLLSEDGFRSNATRLRQELANYGGPPLAADLIETLV